LEDEIDQFDFSSDEWIVMKDLNVFVMVGSTDHSAKIDSMVRLSDELVDINHCGYNGSSATKNLRLIYHQ
jgi:hypothetical protein